MKLAPRWYIVECDIDIRMFEHGFRSINMNYSNKDFNLKPYFLCDTYLNALLNLS